MITGMPRIAIAVRDFTAALTLFRDKLGMPVVDISESSVASLGAKLAMCTPVSGSNIELMSPADPQAPLSQSLQRFLDRRGEGLFALMLEAKDPDAEAKELTHRGLNVLPTMAGASGRDVHPNSTHGVLIRVYPVGSFQGHGEVTGDAPGLTGIKKVIIAVNDLKAAISTYGGKFALEIDKPISDQHLGVRRAICRPPGSGVIELVEVLNADKPFAKSIARFLDKHREGMYALVLESTDLSACAEILTARGLEVSAVTPYGMELTPHQNFGVLIRIETG